ncbi:MAG: hypothetical protein ACT4P7_20305 [Gemmatimonadaceae bacterium]
MFTLALLLWLGKKDARRLQTGSSLIESVEERHDLRALTGVI